MKCENQPVDIEVKVRQDCYNRGYKQGKKDTVEEIEDKIQELLNTPFDGKTEKQKYQRKGMEEGLKMALEIIKECKDLEV